MQLATERVIEVRHWNDSLFSFRTTRDPGFRFDSGHFVMVGLEVDGKPLLRAYSNDVYFQVGLITIIGLSAKNAILIIEFAKDLQAQGKGVIEAALTAAHLRFRPIVMTSLAFGLGVVPLAIASGAGSAPSSVSMTSELLV